MFVGLHNILKGQKRSTKYAGWENWTRDLCNNTHIWYKILYEGKSVILINNILFISFNFHHQNTVQLFYSPPPTCVFFSSTTTATSSSLSRCRPHHRTNYWDMSTTSFRYAHQLFQICPSAPPLPSCWDLSTTTKKRWGWR
jgi:hypothetical protein